MDASPAPAPAATAIPRETLIEALGYAAAAAGLSAAAIVSGETTGSGARIAFDAVTVVVLFAAGALIGTDAGVFGRMKSVFWFLSVFAFAGLAGTLVGDVLEVTGRALAVLTTALITGYAAFLWALSKRALQAIALFGAGLGLVVSLVFSDTGFGSGLVQPDVTGPILAAWAYGWAWVGGAMLGIFEPRRSALVSGAVAAILAPLFLRATDNGTLGQILALGSAVLLLLLGERLGVGGLSGLAVAAILLVPAVIVGDHVSEQGPAIAVLAVGVALLAGAIALVRAGAPEAPTAFTAVGPPSAPPPEPPPPEPPSAAPPPPEPPRSADG